jgi:hydroxymethylbilane synthase
MNQMPCKVASRDSPLARAQVAEVLHEIQQYHPEITFEPVFVKSHGDLDQTTSLRSLDKTDFFTREIDLLVLSAACQIAVHSAKDLPDPIQEGIEIIAITKGVDPQDVLVMRPGMSLESLPKGAVIATSSKRREDNVKKMRDDLVFVDLRGTIHDRLALLDRHEVDGVVVANAALIRLNLTHYNSVVIPGETTPLQGQLAIVCKAGDLRMRKIFSAIDTRKNTRSVLYLGLRSAGDKSIHLPLIEVIGRGVTDPAIAAALKTIAQITHIVLTSQTAAELLFSYVNPLDLKDKMFIAVGTATCALVRSFGCEKVVSAAVETAEGVVKTLSEMDLENAYLLWPHSALSRPVISDWLKDSRVKHIDVVFYDTHTKKQNPLPSLDQFDEIVFTSPSIVKAFIECYGALPKDKILTPIGPITKNFLLEEYVNKC